MSGAAPAGAGGPGRGPVKGRAGVPGLVSRYPLGVQLPGVYAEDDFIQRFTAGLDEVLAPVLCTLDNFPAYLDPALAPADFVALLAAWLGAEPEAGAGADTGADGGTGAGAGPGAGVLRSAVTGAVRAHAVRGTRAGLAEAVRLAFGAEPEITESGGAAGSTTPGAPLPGSARPHLTVRLRVPDPAGVDPRALTALVSRNRPAHLPFTVEIRSTGPVAGG